MQAGIYILIYTLFGSLPLLLVLLINFQKVSLGIFYIEIIGLTAVSDYLKFILVFAFLVKIPLYFFHLWLPKAHVEAPVAGSIILAGILLKLGGYGVFRVSALMDFEQWGLLGEVVMAIRLFGSVRIGLICLRQVDIKSLIAYSSVRHISLVIGGFLSNSFWSSIGSLVLILGHGLCSSGLFCVANIMYERFYTRSLMLLKGIILFFPSLTLWWFVFRVINIGAPPFINLLGEILLLGGIIK